MQNCGDWSGLLASHMTRTLPVTPEIEHESTAVCVSEREREKEREREIQIQKWLHQESWDDNVCPLKTN